MPAWLSYLAISLLSYSTKIRVPSEPDPNLLSTNQSRFPVRTATQTFLYRAINGKERFIYSLIEYLINDYYGKGELCFVQTSNSDLAPQPAGQSPGTEGLTTCILCA